MNNNCGNFKLVTYAPVDKKTGKNSINDGLKFAQSEISLFDKDKNGTTTINEFKKGLIKNLKEKFKDAEKAKLVAKLLTKLINLDGNKNISAAEYLAYTMFTDATGNMDGTITCDEQEKAENLFVNDPVWSQSQIQRLYDGHNLAKREKQLNLQG